LNQGALEPTLGEILREILSAPACPPQAYFDDLAAMQAAGRHLAREIADHTVLALDQVFEAMTTLPDNILALLDSPQGRTVIASYIASGERVPDPFFKPTIH
jgi:hypothetical protein